MMTPAAFAAALHQPLLEPLATAAGEGVEERCLQTNAGSDPIGGVIPTGRTAEFC